MDYMNVTLQCSVEKKIIPLYSVMLVHKDKFIVSRGKCFMANKASYPGHSSNFELMSHFTQIA